jgi:hypothetical protein
VDFLATIVEFVYEAFSQALNHNQLDRKLCGAQEHTGVLFVFLLANCRSNCGGARKFGDWTCEFRRFLRVIGRNWHRLIDILLTFFSGKSSHGGVAGKGDAGAGCISR